MRGSRVWSTTRVGAVVKTVQVRVIDSHGGVRATQTAEALTKDGDRSMWALRYKKQPPIRSLIGEGTVLHGEVRFSEGLRIDGEVHGDVVAVGDDHSILVISEKARVHRQGQRAAM